MTNNYLKGTGGEPISTRADWTPPKRRKAHSSGGSRRRNETPVNPETSYDAKVQWEYGRQKRKEKISSYIEKKDWEGVEKCLNTLSLVKKSWIQPTVLFTQIQLLSIDCPESIRTLLRELSDKKTAILIEISVYVDQNNWSGLEMYLKNLLLTIKKSWVKGIMLFTQSTLKNKALCPDEINVIIKTALKKKE